ncbi:ankyrin repeat and MYND domain-containing protein 2-like [Tubulanus polymorphus]|uniref:ankyrin repeat and MYND domain-containing protein 2-like n=1 Tax=Tubulanus polymorphus TaxID=672921 RepID=UPI003DA5E103
MTSVMAPSPPQDDLTETEAAINTAINANKIDEVEKLLLEPGVRINCLDKNGMTFLQHAAYRGCKSLCELLLRRGADVNSHKHDHGYTTLMFAALTGKEDVVTLILEAGAVKSETNKVHRTAGQMAAFVGQHRVATLINNFFSREELDYYTIPQGFEKEPKLPREIAAAVHKTILTWNLHPVKIAMFMVDNEGLLMNCKKIAKVFDLISSDAFQSKQCNEGFSIKLHYLAEIVRKIESKYISGDNKLELLIKSLLRGRDSDGYPENQDKIIRECLKSYPYVDSHIFAQLIRQLASSKIGTYPSTLETFRVSLHGPMSNPDDEYDCDTCATNGAKKRCVNCKKVHYCDQRCQKLHWFMHKKFCKELAVLYQKEEEEKTQIEAEEATKKQEIEANKNQEAEAALISDKDQSELETDRLIRNMNGNGDTVGINEADVENFGNVTNASDSSKS